MMWISNSFFYYKNGMPAVLRGMADAAQQPAVPGAMITMGGYGFDWHDAASYFQPDTVGRYSFVGDNVIQFNPQGRLYDSAVCTAPGFLDTRLHYAARLKVVSRRAARASSGLR
jgi:hypothetical protein